METCAWIGALLLGFCGLPQAIKCWKEGHAEGLSWGFLLMWAGGEVMTLAYVISKMDMALMFNYIVNTLLIFVILFYKVFPRPIPEPERSLV